MVKFGHFFARTKKTNSRRWLNYKLLQQKQQPLQRSVTFVCLIIIIGEKERKIPIKTCLFAPNLHSGDLARGAPPPSTLPHTNLFFSLDQQQVHCETGFIQESSSSTPYSFSMVVALLSHHQHHFPLHLHNSKPTTTNDTTECNFGVWLKGRCRR